MQVTSLKQDVGGGEKLLSLGPDTFASAYKQNAYLMGISFKMQGLTYDTQTAALSGKQG